MAGRVTPFPPAAGLANDDASILGLLPHLDKLVERRELGRYDDDRARPTEATAVREVCPHFVRTGWLEHRCHVSMVESEP